ncbi:MAG: transcription-repair coupling factor [Clostridia bacterium]|nr:transcription-repair coupling factor [Clostridia bacterium]
MSNPIVKEMLKFSKFNKLLEDIKLRSKNISITGITDAAKAHLIYSLYNYSKMIPIIVCPNVSYAKKMIQDLKYYSNTEIVFFPAREITYYSYDSQSREIENARVYAINKLVNKEECIIVTTIEAIMQKMLPKESYEGLKVSLRTGASFSLEKLIESCNKLGYQRVELVEGQGQFSVRGGLVDIFASNSNEPVRIEFFGEEIDSIRTFSVENQRSNRVLSSYELYFSNEFIMAENDIIESFNKLEEKVQDEDINGVLSENIKEDIEKLKQGNLSQIADKYFDLFFPKACSFIDYLTEEHIVYFDEITKDIERSKRILFENEETQRIMIEKNEVYPQYTFKYYTFDEIEQRYNHIPMVYIENINQGRVLHAKRKEYSFSCREVNFFRSAVDIFKSDIRRYQEENKVIVLVFSTLARVETVKNLLNDAGINTKFVQDITMAESLNAGVIYITTGIISSGFVYDEMDLVVISEQVSGIKNKTGKDSKEFLGEVLNSYEDLKIGDYVVHLNHGIGKYLGIEQVEIDGVVKDYIKIMYQEEGVLYIPVTSLDAIKKYVCEDGYVPKLNKLGGKAWQATKERVGKHVKNIAKELVKLYAKRKMAQGFAFSKDTPWQQQFEQDFEYELTEDQQRCVEELKKDMESTKPMDRLLCGDVGYGKTEVAIRGAFKAVMDSKQVAYLVPTTVLSLQQYNVFKSRMEQYGINVEMLSRFRSKKEQDEIIKKLETGEIDIIVGTHRLLSKDVKFKDLGLLIIDEEHRFGVEHKEVIKKYRNEIDVLSMTATPIPRTLHMSMIGIRDMSIILEPPKERLPVHTYVLEYSRDVVKEGIEKELERDGQVFYLSNRVENIELISEKVKSLVPNARVEIAHGKMTANKIEDVMMSFMNHDIDVLVCTTILESGIDIPNANTIIVENADKLGLAQLYQIRGRVGRSNRLSYAYVTYNKSSVISEEADKRLKAIKDYTEFGSGFKIALRDLEIRGAGNLLGSEQSGHMLAVGYDMYASLLERAVHEEKLLLENKVETPEVKNILEDEIQEVKINLDVSANIPENYISDNVIKMEMYQKLSNARNDEKLQDIIDEIIDRFGDMPIETKNLIDIIKIRNICRELGISEIKVQGEFLVIISNYVKNNIKYRLTNNSKRDILSYVEVALTNLKKTIGVTN